MNDTDNRVVQVLAEMIGRDVGAITDDHILAPSREQLHMRDTHLDMDSLDVVDFHMHLEEEFGIDIPDEDMDDPAHNTVGGVKTYVARRMREKEAA